MATYLSKADYPSVLNVKNIREILGIGRPQAYQLVNSGEFYCTRVGKRILVAKDVFLNWLEGK
ncbi:DNA binding domain-containing protein, excisionase family [Paenibacillus sp. yr247]|uniref:helix-turn-helix domain-containing protein n=1 Tax=Paenibacillus sp. yr247 TaxID=1761880 RepID=UPI0008823CBC|nr:helix-turn-helix domain-containing protein [Paenibacillus sp. yr247]SDN34027.1 DNA binding domain-containing protein, excisionase family [Paenibacillus sp. yr247]